MRAVRLTILVSFLVCLPSLALADDAPKGLGTGVDAASKGQTDVTKEGFDTVGKKDDPDKVAITEVSVNVGALLAAGNSRSLALTSAVKSKVRREKHQFTGAAALNYAQAGKTGQAETTSVENLQGLLRYDFFISERVTAFCKVSAMHDRFQGLNLRLNVDPGMGYYFIQDKTLKVWGELGYDFLFDVRRDDVLLQKDGTMLEKTKSEHGMRAFLGYDHKLNAAVQLVAGIEYLQAFTNFDAFRLNADAGLKANLSPKFALASTVGVRYDHNALPGKEATDVLTSISLAYTLF